MISTDYSVMAAGYLALDVVVTAEGIWHSAGGTAGNVAANLAFLGCPSALAAVVGNDPVGDHLRRDLADAGVRTKYISRTAGSSTPVVIHEVTKTGHRYLFGCTECGRRFSRHRPLPLAAAERIAADRIPDAFFFDRLSDGTLYIASAVREAGGLVMFEPATSGHAAMFQRAMELAHIVKFSDDRERVFGERLGVPRHRQYQVRTAGVAGTFWRRGSTDWKHLPALEIPVADAGGAGDWMTAGLLWTVQEIASSAIRMSDFRDALQFGQALAALSCQVPGARGLSRSFTVAQVKESAITLLEAPSCMRPATHMPPRRRRRAQRCPTCLADSLAAAR